MATAFLLLAMIPIKADDSTLRVSERQGSFALVENSRAATIAVGANEPIAVQKAATLFADDVERVTGLHPRLTGKATRGSVVIATIGHNAYVDKLIKLGRIDASAILGGWEQFVIREYDNRLFIIGSDRRGTAYGVFTLSEQIGVSPWYWWADVPVQHHNQLFVSANYTSKAPTIKYRGIFINDEDWGLLPWSANNFERELGDIGPRTYAKVCELLLRLKANMLAPAMHPCTGAFYSHLESAAVADSFGIVITTSHCEPLLLNNAAESEWNQKRDGEWNYKTNRNTIYKKWDDRLAEAARYENIYTVAMRGVHDEGLRGSLPMKERVPLLEQAITDQRDLLVKHKAYTPTLPSRKTPSTAHDIPQIFVPYKETMDIYENGLRVPDDITLVWVDDNYGYMKRVANPDEQRRSGRSGVYYHLSYLGAPHDYLWVNTTPPVLMYEELMKAYATGADRYWLLNVGDIKPMELGIQTFMDLAWDVNAFSIETINRHQADYLVRLFSGSPLSRFQSSLLPILDTYYRLAWSRKPEYMGFEYEWDDKDHTGLKSTDFSFSHYDEAQCRLAEYGLLSNQVERLATSCFPTDTISQSAFFQLLQFPVQASYQMNRKFLMAQLNHELLAEGRTAEANWAARQMEQAYDSINALIRRYNTQLGGKWNGMMDIPPGYCALYHQKPQVVYTPDADEKSVPLTPLHMVGTGCHVIDLAKPESQSGDVRLIEGIGYDWQVVQLGNAVENTPASVTYRLPAASADTIDAVLYTVPFWPLYEGKGNAVSVSIDGSVPQVFSNRFKEYDRSWKDQVMRNGAVCRLRFAIDASQPRHTITLSSVDPGQMIQRIIIDWGGLQPSYMGPQNSR